MYEFLSILPKTNIAPLPFPATLIYIHILFPLKKKKKNRKNRGKWGEKIAYEIFIAEDSRRALWTVWMRASHCLELTLLAITASALFYFQLGTSTVKDVKHFGPYSHTARNHWLPLCSCGWRAVEDQWEIWEKSTPVLGYLGQVIPFRFVSNST